MTTPDILGRPAPGAAALATGGLLALAAAMGVGRFIYTPILPLMVDGLGLSQGQAGLIASANFAGYLLGALLAAFPSLPGSRRAWFLGALAASATTTAMMGLAQSVVLFSVIRFLGGAASAFVLVMASALVLERLAAIGRPGLASINFSGVGVGIAASALLMMAMTALHADWRAAWLAAGGVSAVALVIVMRLIPHGADATPVRKAADDRAAAGGFRWLALSYGLFGFGYVITATFIVALVRANAETRPLEPYVWLIVGAAGAPSVPFWSWLARRMGLFNAYALACVVEAVGVVASVQWLSASGVMIAAIFLGGTIMGITALGLAGARVLSSADARRAFALMTAAFGVGQIIGPSFAGAMHDATGSFVAPSLAAAAALIVAAGLGLIAKPPAAQ